MRKIILLMIIFYIFCGCGEAEKEKKIPSKIKIEADTAISSQMRNINNLLKSAEEGEEFQNISYALTADAINLGKLNIYNYYPDIFKYRFAYFDSTFKYIIDEVEVMNNTLDIDKKWKDLIEVLKSKDKNLIDNFCIENNINEKFFHILTDNLINGKSSLGISESLPIEIGLILNPQSAQMYYDRAILNTLFQPKNYKFYRQYDMEKANELSFNNETVKYNLAMAYFDLGYFEQFNNIFFDVTNQKDEADTLKIKYNKMLENQMSFTNKIIFPDVNEKYQRIKKEIIPDYIRIEGSNDTEIFQSVKIDTDIDIIDNSEINTNKNYEDIKKYDDEKNEITEKFWIYIFLVIVIISIIFISVKLIRKYY